VFFYVDSEHEIADKPSQETGQLSNSVKQAGTGFLSLHIIAELKLQSI
jgi:hypothetical protein